MRARSVFWQEALRINDRRRILNARRARDANDTPDVEMTPASVPAAAGGEVANPIPVVEMTPANEIAPDVEMRDADNLMQP